MRTGPGAARPWILTSIEQGAEGRHALDEQLVAAPWSDDQTLRDEALVEGAVADGGARRGRPWPRWPTWTSTAMPEPRRWTSAWPTAGSPRTCWTWRSAGPWRPGRRPSTATMPRWPSGRAAGPARATSPGRSERPDTPRRPRAEGHADQDRWPGRRARPAHDDRRGRCPRRPLSGGPGYGSGRGGKQVAPHRLHRALDVRADR